LTGFGARNEDRTREEKEEREVKGWEEKGEGGGRIVISFSIRSREKRRGKRKEGFQTGFNRIGRREGKGTNGDSGSEDGDDPFVVF
jgi:hypothetical protein